MNIKLIRISDANDISKERVVLKILSDSDIGRYGLLRVVKNGEKITSKVYNTFWFPDRVLKTNDLVVLYTKKGVGNIHQNTDGSTSHFFYWGMDQPIWIDEVAPVLVSIPEWQTLQ